MANATYTPTHCPETGRKFTKAERKAANKAKYAAERAAQAALKPKSKRKAKAQKASPKPKAVSVPTRKAKLMRMTKAQLVDLIIGAAPKRKPKAKRKPTQAVRKPKRSSADGLEQAQARTATAQRVGKVQKTKVVHAVTGKEAQPFEPRMEVPVEERKQVKREQMRLTLLPGESPEQGIRRMKIQQAQAEAEAYRIEAEQLTMNFEA
jgi:hypothetical protein